MNVVGNSNRSRRTDIPRLLYCFQDVDDIVLLQSIRITNDNKYFS